MPNFAGTWKMRSSENFDELLKALGKLRRTARPFQVPQAREGWALGADSRQEGGPGVIDRGAFRGAPRHGARGPRDPRVRRLSAGRRALSPTAPPLSPA